MQVAPLPVQMHREHRILSAKLQQILAGMYAKWWCSLQHKQIPFRGVWLAYAKNDWHGFEYQVKCN